MVISAIYFIGKSCHSKLNCLLFGYLSNIMYFTENAIDQILQGVKLADKSKKDDEIFKVPIIIIPGNLPFFS